MEDSQNLSELWLGERVLSLQCVLDWAKTLEELQINSSDFRQSLSAPLVYEPANLSFTASLSAVFIIAFILRGSVQVNSPVRPSSLQPCEIIFCSIRCCEPLTSISSQWQSEIRRLLQSRVPSSSTSSYGGVKSQGALEGHRGLGLHPPLWSLCSSHFICWRAFNLLFHARRLSISNGSFILNAMINSFHPKGLGEKWHSFCISDSQAVWTQGFMFCPGKKPLVAQVRSPSLFFSLLHVPACTRTHARTPTVRHKHTHSIDRQPLGTNLALCVHSSCTNASNTSVIYCN